MSQVGKNEMPVSVVICTYNRAQALGECIDSVLAQDYPACEIVVVSGSTADGTDEALSSYPLVKVVRQEGGRGLADARNQGIKASSAEVIVFIDDDAIACKGWLRILTVPLKDDESVGAVGGKVVNYRTDRIEFMNGIIYRSGRTKTVNELPQKYFNTDGNAYNNLMGANMAVRKSAIEKIGFFDTYYHYYNEDPDIAVRLVRAGYKVVHEPAALVRHFAAPGPNRRSRFDVNWYLISKTTVYFTLKNFGKEISPVWVGLLTFSVYTRRLLKISAFFLLGQVSIPLFIRSVWDLTKGYVDGFKDYIAG